MISIKKAYEKVFIDMYPGQYSPSVLETENMYVFYPRPNNVSSSDTYCSGTIFPAVNKFTGSVFTVSISKIATMTGVVHKINIER